MNHLLPPNPMFGPFDADGHFKIIREREEQMRREAELREQERRDRMMRDMFRRKDDLYDKY